MVCVCMCVHASERTHVRRLYAGAVEENTKELQNRIKAHHAATFHLKTQRKSAAHKQEAGLFLSAGFFRSTCETFRCDEFVKRLVLSASCPHTKGHIICMSASMVGRIHIHTQILDMHTRVCQGAFSCVCVGACVCVWVCVRACL